ncbi:MAG: hypothetical protein WCG27_03515, partial [Pseudomonadota bacterium]
MTGQTQPAIVPAPCSTIYKEKMIEEKLATAAIMANFRNKFGSLKYTLSAALTNAEENLSSNPPPRGLCPSICQADPISEIVFTSIPNEFLKDYSDFEKCQRLEQQTLKTPILFANKTFNSTKQFFAWYNDFSQGKGPEGRALYT